MPAKSYTPEEAKLRRLELLGRAYAEELEDIKNNREPMKRKGPKKGTVRKRFLCTQPALVRRMHRDHLAGMNLFQLGLKYDYRPMNIKRAFERLGLDVRLSETLGQFQRTLVPHTDAQIVALARQTKRVMVPHVLRWEWRRWPLERKWWLIQELVKIHGWAFDLPPGPYSANVTPFQYGTPAAHATAAAVNAGLPSRQWLCHLKINSRGVIYGGHLWCYVPGNGYVRGQFKLAEGRKVLHREIYKEHHGPIPPDCVVRFRDGNENNLDPANLYLATQSDVLRETQSRVLTERSRARTAALLKQSQKKGTHELTRLLGPNHA